MSARVDFPLKFPARVVLILIFCVCLVTVHAVADGFLPHYGQGDLNADSWQEIPELEDGDEGLISPIHDMLADGCMTITHSDLALPGSFSFSISPQLPPPN
jgi:hypothetical protein